LVSHHEQLDGTIVCFGLFSLSWQELQDLSLLGGICIPFPVLL
jgi:hypothetical protein